VLPYDCAALSRWDPGRGAHRTVAVVGYPAEVLASWTAACTPTRCSTRSAEAGAGAGAGHPGPRRRGDVFDTVIDPLGFRDGVTQCLVAADGRYLGMLNASTLDRRHPTTTRSPCSTCSPTTWPRCWTRCPRPDGDRRARHGGAEGLYVTGTSLFRCPPVPPRPGRSRSPLRPLLDAVLAGSARAAPALVLVGHDLLDVTLEPRPGGSGRAAPPAAPPFGLTPRELEVLAAVSLGRTNTQIAAALRITPRTVATHVEHAGQDRCPEPRRRGPARGPGSGCWCSPPLVEL
jgi:DNA-binding CsgD family transcriptional regulator